MPDGTHDTVTLATRTLRSGAACRRLATEHPREEAGLCDPFLGFRPRLDLGLGSDLVLFRLDEGSRTILRPVLGGRNRRCHAALA